MIVDFLALRALNPRAAEALVSWARENHRIREEDGELEDGSIPPSDDESFVRWLLTEDLLDGAITVDHDGRAMVSWDDVGSNARSVYDPSTGTFE